VRRNHSKKSIPHILKSIHAETPASRWRGLFFYSASRISTARWKDETWLVGFVGVHDDLSRLTSTGKATALSNKLAGPVVIGKIFGKCGAIDADEEVFSDFIVQVGGIHAAICSNRPDLLPSRDLLAFANHDLIQVGIHRVHHFELTTLDERMPHNHHIPPPHAGIHCEGHIAIAYAINWRTEVAIAACHAIPILARMVGQEPSGHVIPLGVGLADRHVKTIRHPHCGTVTPGDSHKASHEEHKKNPKQPASHEGKILHPPTSEPQATRAAGIFLKIHLKVAGTQKIENIAPMSKSFPPRLRPAGHSTASYAIVASKFNQEFVQALVDNAHAELSSLEPGANIVLVWTPGSFEIPLFVQATAELNRFQAVIALGVILEGETEHARLIAEAVTRSLMDLSLKHKLPVIHEVLLVKDEAQARARCIGTEHNRGVEAARAAVSAARKLPEIV